MTDTTSVGARAQSKTNPTLIKSLGAASFGNMLEWFDWTLYGTFSAYLAVNFFDKQDATSGLLSVLAVFAVGFIARPVGGFVFGRLGDKAGRKTGLIVTMCTMAFGSLLIAIIPPYASIGVGASLLLVVARLLQGLAHGGETGVSYTYVAEIAPPKRRGLWASTTFISGTLGVMGATLLGLILTTVLSSDEMMVYGWRIGFLVGASLGIYALYLRRGAHETPVFEKDTSNERKESKLVILGKITLINAGSSVAYYTWVTFAPTYAISQHGMDARSALLASLLAQVVVLFLLPLFGHLSDVFGRKPMLALFGAALIIGPFPIHSILGAEPWTLFVSQGLGLAVWALIVSYFPALLAEQVPTDQRALGVGFYGSLSSAAFGGTAPYLNTWLSSIGLSWVFSVYIMVLGVLAIVAAIIIRETARVPMQEIFKR